METSCSLQSELRVLLADLLHLAMWQGKTIVYNAYPADCEVPIVSRVVAQDIRGMMT